MSDDLRPIPSAPGYAASADGGIFSMLRGAPRRLRTVCHNGYHQLVLRIEGKQRLGLAHRLVCEAFHGPALGPNMQVRHLDGSRDNNVPTNLRWGTGRENMADKRVHGTAQVGDKNAQAKLSATDVASIRARAARGVTQAALAREYRVTGTCIWGVVTGNAWVDEHMPDMSNRATRHGETKATAKLTNADVISIRAAAAAGVPYHRLSRSFNVSFTHVGRIVRREAWAHLDGEVVCQKA